MKIYEYLCGNLNHIKKQGENDKVSHWGLPGTNEDTQTKPPTFYNEPINGSARHIISGHFLFICRWTFTLFQGLIPHTEDVLWTIFCKFFPRIHRLPVYPMILDKKSTIISLSNFCLQLTVLIPWTAKTTGTYLVNIEINSSTFIK